MLFVDPLSRVCAPTEGWHEPSIPSKVATLLKHLPNAIRETPRIKLYAGKDTSGISKIIYKWRKSKNLLAASITQGKLSAAEESSGAFHIGVEDVNKVVHLCKSLIMQKKLFAVLIPMSIVGEIARLENDAGERLYDPELITAVEKLSRVILAQDAEMWLISIEDHHICEFITLQKQMEENLHEITSIRESVAKARNSKINKTLKSDIAQIHPDQGSDENILTHIMLPTTRGISSQRSNSTTIPLRKRRAIHKSTDKAHEEGGDHRKDQPTLKLSRIKWKRIPR
jgi:hypothetical protein